MKLCYIVDIDGTIANGDHRLHHIQKQPKDWDAYFAAADSDVPIEHMRRVVLALHEHAPVIYVSGRSDQIRDLTVAWLLGHGFPFVALYMREQGDHKPDDVLKIELLDKLRGDGYSPIMVFDDRNRVVEAWRTAGIPCAQVAAGDF